MDFKIRSDINSGIQPWKTPLKRSASHEGRACKTWKCALSWSLWGRIFTVRERRQTDRRRISHPTVWKGMMYIHTLSIERGIGSAAGRCQGWYFWRKTNGVVKEEGTFLEKSRKLDPSRIFFMGSRGVSAHGTSRMERLVRTQSSPHVTVLVLEQRGCNI